jgi:hypothetical protein
LRLLWAEKAKEFSEWAAEQSHVVSSVTTTGKPLEEQLAQAQENVLHVQKSTDRYTSMITLTQQLDDARITDNKHTELTIEILKLKWEKLNHLAKETEEVIQKQLLSRTNSEVSPDELKEFRECFDHFDKDANGMLARLELDSCLKVFLSSIHHIMSEEPK